MLSDKIQQLREDGYTRAELDEIADEMEEIVGQAEMWNILRLGFHSDEYLENLEYIARECDL